MADYVQILRIYLAHLRCKTPTQSTRPRWCDVHAALEEAIRVMSEPAAQPPAVGVDVSHEIADLRAEVEVLRRAVHTGISVIVESCSPRGNPDIDDASEIAAALHDMRAVLPNPLPEFAAALRTGGGA